MKFLYYLLLCSTAIFYMPVANAQYKGGSYDGFDAVSIIQLTNTNIAYTGGRADGFAIVSTDIILPVKFGNFTAVYKKQTDAVQLEWQTLTEINTSYFMVQQSVDNIIWNTLQQVVAKGNSSVIQSYMDTHLNPPSGKNFYRIVTVDNDGRKSISPVQLVTVNSETSITVVHFNNPVTDVLKLQISTQQAGEYSITLLQANGSQISQRQLQLGSGISNLSFDLNGKSAGIYYLVIKKQNTTTAQTFTIVKQ